MGETAPTEQSLDQLQATTLLDWPFRHRLSADTMRNANAATLCGQRVARG
jgi:hypothetical protein